MVQVPRVTTGDGPGQVELVFIARKELLADVRGVELAKVPRDDSSSIFIKFIRVARLRRFVADVAIQTAHVK